MMELQAIDTPVFHPDRDLLDMTSHAKRLAAFLQDVELPFTLGIYGEWGEGKTSFVKLLVHFLKTQTSWQELRFVEFSAWPYISSDAIWRALLLRIAAEMYGVERTSDKEPQLREEGLVPALARFLNHEALVLRKPEVSPDGQGRYRALAAKVDRSLATIANRSQSVAANQTGALTALTTAFLELASGFTPWLSGLRKLFGLDKPIDTVGTSETGSDGSRHEVVESVEAIRGELRRMFEYDANKRLVVLVDDLDRCMPEAALDILEMMKIFFFESREVQTRCLFVVAADRELIGQGLNARFRAMTKGEENSEIRKMLRHKGREYFEKIIQFGVQVPQKSSEQSHRFVATHFPSWGCATDILRCSAGTNPRRLKQQCNLLSYKHSVAQEIGAS